MSSSDTEILMKQFWKTTNWAIALTATVGVGLVGMLAGPAFGWDMLQKPDVGTPDSPMEDMSPHQETPMQMSGEMLELMGELQQLMSTLTPEQMAEFRPDMMEHHDLMAEEMQLMIEQLRELTGPATEIDAI
jgi:hypothetical protein